MSGTKIPRTDYFKVPFTALQIDEDNAREDLGDIEALAESILNSGVQNPVIGYKKNGVFVITDGKRRYYACKYIYEKLSVGYNVLIPFVPEQKGTTETDRILSRIILNDGKPYTPLELSNEIIKLRNLKVSNKEIAQKAGLTEVYVSNLIKLNKAPDEVKNLIVEGVVKSTAVMQWHGEWDEFIDKIEDIQKESQERNSEKVPSKKVTTGQLKINSLSIFKEYSKKIEYKNVSTDKMLFYDFMLKLSSNELLTNDFEDFFGAKIEQ